eukprot:5253221-Prymnesium_polylepis.1
MLTLVTVLSSLTADLPLATFDGAPASTREWTTVNDPVMGGASISTFEQSGAVGIWTGEVKVVPFLHAPGFCTLTTTNTKKAFPDCSNTSYMSLTLTNGSGLPSSDFMMQAGVHGVTSDGSVYQANCSTQYCCANDCRIPWSAFVLTWRGERIKGPSLASNLDKLNRVGIGTAGTAGKFSLSIKSITASTTASSAHCEGSTPPPSSSLRTAQAQQPENGGGPTSSSKDKCFKTCGGDYDCGGCGFCYPAPHSCCSSGVSTPLDCPNGVE